jgi:hypothetical protein
MGLAADAGVCDAESVTLNSKQKLLVAIVALGGVVVGADRLLMGGRGGPASAAAATPEDAGPGVLERKAAELTPRGAGGSVQSSGAVRPVGENRVRARLAALGARGDADAAGFVVPASWGVGLEAQTREAAGPAPVDASPAAERPEFRMTMLVRRSGAAVAAVINGRTVRVGETVDGYRLVSLSGGRGAGSGTSVGAVAAEAVLEGAGGAVRVALDPAGGDR